MAKHLTNEQAQQLVDNYKKTIKQGDPSYNKAGQEITDQTKWVWFPKWQLQKVLDSFETSTVEEDEQGIKFYLGVYGDEPVRGTEDMTPYVGLITLVMVPSYKDPDGNHIDYHQSVQRLSVGDPEPGPFDDEAENAGDMCPPTCNDSGGGDDF